MPGLQAAVFDVYVHHEEGVRSNAVGEPIAFREPALDRRHIRGGVFGAVWCERSERVLAWARTVAAAASAGAGVVNAVKRENGMALASKPQGGLTRGDVPAHMRIPYRLGLQS